MKKEKILITGISGFVGPYLKKELEDTYEVYGLDREGDANDGIFKCDLLDPDSLKRVVEKVQPVQVYHLAGFSSVKASFDNPELAFRVNVDGTRNLLEALNGLNKKPKVLIVSSAEVYGKPESLPIKEDNKLSPMNPYAESRIAQEKLLNEFDLSINVARSFNHTGPGQPDMFVIPAFAKQIVEREKKIDSSPIKVGNLEAQRDFSDVRDVVRAYRLILEKGQAKEIYNVSSGEAYVIQDILDKLIELSAVEIKVESDPERMRPSEIAALQGDNSKLVEHTGFKNKISLEETLESILKYWRSVL